MSKRLVRTISAKDARKRTKQVAKTLIEQDLDAIFEVIEDSISEGKTWVKFRSPNNDDIVVTGVVRALKDLEYIVESENLYDKGASYHIAW